MLRITPARLSRLWSVSRGKSDMYSLRPYQAAAVRAGVDTLRNGGRGVAVLPTGSGKSLVIASVARELLGNTIVFQPNKEILEQNLQKMIDFGFGDDTVVFSASLGKKEVGKITLATIGSIYNRPELWTVFDNAIIDECHTVNADGGMYKEFIDAHNGSVFGLTATPYRLHQYTDIYRENFVVAKFLTRTRPRVFKDICHITQIREMYELGFLAPVEYTINDAYKHSAVRLNSTGMDFDDKSLKLYNEQMDIVGLVAKAIRTDGSRHILVFNKFVHEAVALADELSRAGITSASISAETPKADRERIITDFRSGKIRVVTNVGVLTTGFDFPALDCIILARPTQSVALYYQMIGRGVRIAPNKERVRVIDVCGNVPRFGRIESFEIVATPEKPDLIRLRSDASFLTGYDFVHGVDVEEIGYKGLSEAISSAKREDARKAREAIKKQLTEEGKVTFGKYQGQPLIVVPDGYVQWVLENFEKGDKRTLFEKEWTRRNAERSLSLPI